MTGTHVTRLRTPKRRARSKKKANRKVVVFEFSEGSVVMTKGTTSTMDEDTREELNLRIGGREKYTVSKEAGFYVELVKNRTCIKQAATVKTTEETKRKCAKATTKATERVASLTSECATMTITLQEREEHIRAKEIECEVLRLNLIKEKEFRIEEKMRTEDLGREIAVMKTERMELREGSWRVQKRIMRNCNARMSLWRIWQSR
ncbi:hypothetical protein AXG93_4080s1130 [Marchantia polymorpha subsp. ruderalis]|uniref:Uncharacterized protein n=1 Tax=Marchantia polymorpha subsp. ruderalis TaxID=1480154 RepID=A0A176VW50_MARPO|nr:hypothetical protein AXG93_4080s1130 [Marchantia polymorpha subsp. ruderalis]